jgi:hypothetical protein
MKNIDALWHIRRTTITKFAIATLCLSIIAFSISIFVYSGILRGLNIFFDFFVFYTAGWLWNEGLDPYNPELFRTQLNAIGGHKVGYAYFYPPQGTILFALLAKLPLVTAHQVLLGVNLTLIVTSLCLMAYILSWYRPIGLLEITLLVSFLNTGYGRVTLRNSQWGALILVFLLTTFILARHGRQVLAGVTLAAITFKPSFLPLYVGYYLLRRSYRLVLICVLAAGFFTITPLLITGRSIGGTLASWLRLVLLQSAPGRIDSPTSPSGPWSEFMLHMEPLVYRVFNAQSSVTTTISWLIVLTLCGYTAYLIWHSTPSKKIDLLDFGLVSALSLMCIYHRNYDIFLLFPGLLYIYVHITTSSDKNAQLGWAIFLVTILILISLPNDTVLRLSYSDTSLKDNYLCRLIAPFPAWAGLAVLGALLWLKTRSIAPLIRSTTSGRVLLEEV